uniref:hypothetical protein n=1 Tax=Pseudomonas helleri TaxID=1608996 RepID=UPI001E4201B6
MSTDGALSRSRLLPTLLGILLVLMGLAMLVGGIKLVTLGGSTYYLLAGLGFGLSGALLIAGRRAAPGGGGLAGHAGGQLFGVDLCRCHQLFA